MTINVTRHTEIEMSLTTLLAFIVNNFSLEYCIFHDGNREQDPDEYHVDNNKDLLNDVILFHAEYPKYYITISPNEDGGHDYIIINCHRK